MIRAALGVLVLVVFAGIADPGRARMPNGQTYKTALIFARTPEGLIAKWAKASNPPGKVNISGNNISMVLKSDDGRDLTFAVALQSDGSLGGTVQSPIRGRSGITQNTLSLQPKQN